MGIGLRETKGLLVRGVEGPTQQSVVVLEVTMVPVPSWPTHGQIGPVAREDPEGNSDCSCTPQPNSHTPCESVQPFSYPL